MSDPDYGQPHDKEPFSPMSDEEMEELEKDIKAIQEIIPSLTTTNLRVAQILECVLRNKTEKLEKQETFAQTAQSDGKEGEWPEETVIEDPFSFVSDKGSKKPEN